MSTINEDLIATAAELKAKEAANEEIARRREQALMRELPRIYSELASKARAMFDGVPGAKVTVDQSLRQVKIRDRVIGQAQLSEFEISFNGRTLAFNDDPEIYMGGARHVKVVGTGAESPLKDGLRISPSTENPDAYQIWVPADSSVGRAARPQARSLFDDGAFEQTIRRFFSVAVRS